MLDGIMNTTFPLDSTQQVVINHHMSNKFSNVNNISRSMSGDGSLIDANKLDD